MPLYDILERPELADPILVMALTGWVDAAAAGTRAAEALAAGGTTVADFDTDALLDYRANRPVLTFRNGRMDEAKWPALTITHVAREGLDLLVMTGAEPDFKWKELSADLVGLAGTFRVSRLVTLGAIPAQVPHTLPPPVLTTTSDPELLLEDDRPISGDLKVPGAAVSILTEALVAGGIPALGYWVQVPHYVRSPYHRGVLALLEKATGRLGISLDLEEIRLAADAQQTELDEAVRGRPEAEAYLQRLEAAGEGGDVPTADEIGAEVERFLREASDGRDDAGPPPAGP